LAGLFGREIDNAAGNRNGTVREKKNRYSFSKNLYLYSFIVCKNGSTRPYSMKARDLYANVICSEEKAYELLQDEGVFSSVLPCPGYDGSTCGHLMTMDLNRFRWRCFRRACLKQLPMRGENNFFFFEEENGRRHFRLSITSIIELIWFFLYARQTQKEVAYATDHSKPTVIDWYNLMRAVCSQSIETEPKMFGTPEQPV